jgi:hypothetical protein
MDVFVQGVMLLLSELIVILLFTVPLNQANWQFLMDDMLILLYLIFIEPMK